MKRLEAIARVRSGGRQQRELDQAQRSNVMVRSDKERDAGSGIMNGRTQGIGSDWDDDWRGEPLAQVSWAIFGSLGAYLCEASLGIQAVVFVAGSDFSFT